MPKGSASGSTTVEGHASLLVNLSGTAAGKTSLVGYVERPAQYTAAEIAALESEFCSFAGLLRVATPVPLRLWTGVGDFTLNGSAYDPDGSVFQGGGRLIDLPAFERIYNGIAERVTVTLEGVTDNMRTRVYAEAADIRGAIVRLGWVALDGNLQQIGTPKWLRSGRVDTIETENRPGERERIKTISFSVGTLLTGRQVPNAATYTNADQQSRPGSATDRFCERTPLMTQNLVIRWPAFK